MNSVWNNQVQRSLQHFRAFAADHMAHLGLDDLSRAMLGKVKGCHCEMQRWETLRPVNQVEVVNALRRFLRSPEYYAKGVDSSELARFKQQAGTLLMLIDSEFRNDPEAIEGDLPLPEDLTIN